LIERVSFAVPKGIQINSHLLSNGVKLPHLSDLDIKTLFNSMQLTLDGIEEFHDTVRMRHDGTGTFAATLEQIKRCSKLTKVLIRFNVHSDSDTVVVKVMNFLREQNLIGKINFYFSPITEENGSGCQYECISHVEVVDACLKEQERLRQAGDLSTKIYSLPLPKCRECSVDLDSHIVIGEDGTLFKCFPDAGRPEFGVGHIYTGIDKTSLHDRAYCDDDPFKDSRCRNCSIFPVCGGGCPKYRINYKESKCKYTIEQIRRLVLCSL
ncbi:MAG: radical SAM protein, partial [Oligoflexia bacterium]|nr:radical SAM protein [Oligoflexia bacterium]